MTQACACCGRVLALHRHGKARFCCRLCRIEYHSAAKRASREAARGRYRIARKDGSSKQVIDLQRYFDAMRRGVEVIYGVSPATAQRITHELSQPPREVWPDA